MMRPTAIAACLVLCFAAIAACAQETTGSTTAAPAATAATAPTASTAAVTPAAAPAAAVAEGDVQRGRVLTYTCRGCHGVEGYTNAYPEYQVPMIGGQSASYLVSSLSDYRSGARKHPTMQAQAQSFSEQDIADIAAFLSNVK